MKQKTFGIIDTIENEYNAERDKTKIINHIYGSDNSKEESMNAFFAKFNTIFSSFDSEEELKLDLFKRIDIYSFGIMVLYVIKKYIGCLYGKRVIKEKLDYIYYLYHFVYLCCYQNERVANIDNLVVAYNAILLFIYKVKELDVNNIVEEYNNVSAFSELPYQE
jgi:hypothetical protein